MTRRGIRWWLPLGPRLIPSQRRDPLDQGPIGRVESFRLESVSRYEARTHLPTPA